MKYRRILNEVEAIQFTGSLKEVKDFLNDDKAIKKDSWMYDRPIVFLQTAYGVKTINEGDYIVKEGDRILLYTEELFNKLFEEVIENERVNQDEVQNKQN